MVLTSPRACDKLIRRLRPRLRNENIVDMMLCLVDAPRET